MLAETNLIISDHRIPILSTRGGDFETAGVRLARHGVFLFEKGLGFVLGQWSKLETHNDPKPESEVQASEVRELVRPSFEYKGSRSDDCFRIGVVVVVDRGGRRFRCHCHPGAKLEFELSPTCPGPQINHNTIGQNVVLIDRPIRTVHCSFQ